MADTAEAIAAALQRWLHDAGTPSTVTVLGRATVGLSQETWFVDIQSGDTVTEAVLRRPTSASGDRSLLNQIAVLRALQDTVVPVPRLLWAAEGDDHALARPFFVMERFAGTVPVGWHDFSPAQQQTLAEDTIDILAALHAIPSTRLGQQATHTPDLAWYRHRFEKLGDIPPALKAAFWWMERHPPEPSSDSVIVHGDYRMGNLVVNNGRVIGVLDWEMTAVGDPLEDLTWCFIPVWERAAVDELALVRRYEERTGRTITEERFRWYRALGYVRLAYYAMSGTYAFDSGRSNDLRLAALRLRLPVHLDRLMAVVAGERLT